MNYTLSFAIQPAEWTDFNSHECDWAINISDAYKVVSEWQASGVWGDIMIWQVNPGADPIPWERVYGTVSKRFRRVY